MTYHHSPPLSLLSSLTNTVTLLLLTSLVIVSYNIPSSSTSCYVHAFSIVVPSSVVQQQRRLSNNNVHQYQQQHQQQHYQNSRIAANDLTSLYATKGNNKIDVATATAATMMSFFLFVLNVGNANAIDIDNGTTFSSSSIQISEQIVTLDMVSFVMSYLFHCLFAYVSIYLFIHYLSSEMYIIGSTIVQ